MDGGSALIKASLHRSTKTYRDTVVVVGIIITIRRIIRIIFFKE